MKTVSKKISFGFLIGASPVWDKLRNSLLPAALLLAGPLQAQDVWITPELPFFEFQVGGEFHLIERNQDNDARIVDTFAKTSRACPPFCI